MKTKMILVLLLLATTINAQNTKLENALLKNLKQMEEAKSSEDFQNIANGLERIAEAEKGEWLAQYYAGYINLITGMQQEANAKKDEYYDRALSYINKADELSPDNSEICVLKSWALGVKIGIDPMNRGQQLGMEAGMLTAKAIELNPENPRAHFMKGQSAMYTPEQYGGGKNIALRYLENAVAKYKTFKPSSPAMPFWGEKQANEALEKCKTM